MASGETIELIVLSTTKVGEKALVVHTLSREWGRRGFLVHSGAKAGMSRFLPLNILFRFVGAATRISVNHHSVLSPSADC